MTYNKYKLKKKSISFLASLARYLILIGFAYILFYPFLFMALNSIKTPADWLDPTVEWIAKGVTLDNYKAAIATLKYFPSLLSTLKNEIVASLISFLSCALVGYGLARFDFTGKKFLTGVMILCILIPDPMVMIASYNNFHYLDIFGILGGISKLVGHELRPNILDTPFVFWIPAVLGTGLKNGFFIYIYSQFFKGLPKELEEAAWIDGAGPFKTFFKIVLPSSGSATITVLVFSVVWYYNDYYQSQIYLSKNYPLSVMLANLEANLTSEISSAFKLSLGTLILTCSFIAIIPLLIYFLSLQRKFVQSIATCGIVG
ncbi:MAG: carbohydrate ABC transporter permease [Clostridia bacterium]|nr:carbohydrate ABC transporter permease [Clostridia bacterium]